MTVLVLPFAISAILYIVLSFSSVQNALGKRAELELTKLLGTEVSIGEVSFSPFNRLTLSDVSVLDDEGEEALSVGHLGAGINIGESLWNKRIIISYAEFIDMNVKLYKDSANAPLNIQPIIARLKKDDKSEPSKFDLAVNMVVIRRSNVQFDIKDTPAPSIGKFDKNHILISELRADLQAPTISNGKFIIDIKRLAATERSGIVLEEFSSDIKIDSTKATVENLTLVLPSSKLMLGEIDIVSPISPEFNLSEVLLSPVSILEGSHVTLKELSPFVPALKTIDATFDVELLAEGTLDDLEVNKIDISDRELDIWLRGNGHIRNLTKGRDSLSFRLDKFDLGASIPSVSKYAALEGSPLVKLQKALAALAPLGMVNLTGDIGATPKSFDFSGQMFTDCGDVDIDFGLLRNERSAPLKIDGNVSCTSFDPSLLDKKLTRLTSVSLESDFDIAISRNGNINGNVELNIPEIEYSGYNYTDISGQATFNGNNAEIELKSSSPHLEFTLTGGGELRGEQPMTEFFAKIEHIDLYPFVTGQYRDFSLSLEADASVTGRNPDEIDGWLKLSDIIFASEEAGRELNIPVIELEATPGDSIRTIALRSTPVDAVITGHFSFAKLPTEIVNIISGVYPSLLTGKPTSYTPESTFNVDMKIKEDTMLSRFFKLPVDVIYPVTLTAHANSADSTLAVNLDAPYLRQKDKLIEGTRLNMSLDAAADSSLVTVSTAFPTKNGIMNVELFSQGGSDTIATEIQWRINRKEDFHGALSFISSFRREENTPGLFTDIDFRRSQLVFNDSAWNVNPSHISIAPKRIEIQDFGGGRAGQSLSINGVATPDSTERVVISLKGIDLDYIFETLNISDAVMFGGRATGDFYGSALLSKEPILYTPRLNVESLKYNFCEMGDGDIKSYWDNSTKSIGIDAVITQRNGEKSFINGYIRPLTEELDFDFKANKAPVGFMLPFMSAFTSKISGDVSGAAHLFGTFKDLDMTGDIFIDDLSMKLDFTNTTYTTSSAVHITPGEIKFNDVVLKDMYGNTAQLDGYVTHEYFHNPTFKFRVTKAKDLLVYNVDENVTEDPWYGKIFGNGSATVTGVPGKVDIGVTMTTAPKSTFTFVLSDAENATEYDFITLRDRDAAKKDSIAALNAPPLIVRQLKERIKKAEEHPSLYAMEFNVDITPAATMNLIMDPVGGDKIVANGSGHLRMLYSSDGDLRMYGEYTLQRGSYNFTLQDLIIKDFTIKEGSKISFLGDPYAAQLNIEAGYTVNANLSDLDESFLEDKELNRTNVPVEAVLKVRGDMRQPDLSFDLDFPTLTRDTYRKVRSIVSTEDMMNRQIIYLLALNRFYTPDYMSTTHGNELVSVASSTISSRLGSMLGQLSDNWSIAPNIRSDRGDFSDVEVDVALSSHLLNNRLLFNGNFGYRDKSLNNNSFIGDFDIRYLLNRAGTIQLKAYNRYNDQNYYLKSALTTQGVGIVFKRDFDNIFSFLRGIKKNQNPDNSEKSDSTDTKIRTGSVRMQDNTSGNPISSDSTLSPNPTDGIIIRKKNQ